MTWLPVSYQQAHRLDGCFFIETPHLLLEHGSTWDQGIDPQEEQGSHNTGLFIVDYICCCRCRGQ